MEYQTQILIVMISYLTLLILWGLYQGRSPVANAGMALPTPLPRRLYNTPERDRDPLHRRTGSLRAGRDDRARRLRDRLEGQDSHGHGPKQRRGRKSHPRL